MSWATRTCPSQPAPAPMPMVGIFRAGRHLAGQLGGHALQHHGEGAGLLRGQGVLDDALLVALHSEAAEAVHRLRRHADVAHHRDVAAGDRLNGGGAANAAFQLDRVGAAFLDQAAGILGRLLRADLEAHERHVGDQQAAPDAARHQPRVIDHLVQRDGSEVSCPCTTMPSESPTSRPSTPAASSRRAIV